MLTSLATGHQLEPDLTPAFVLERASGRTKGSKPEAEPEETPEQRQANREAASSGAEASAALAKATQEQACLQAISSVEIQHASPLHPHAAIKRQGALLWGGFCTSHSCQESEVVMLVAAWSAATAEPRRRAPQSAAGMCGMQSRACDHCSKIGVRVPQFQCKVVGC